MKLLVACVAMLAATAAAAGLRDAPVHEAERTTDRLTSAIHLGELGSETVERRETTFVEGRDDQVPSEPPASTGLIRVDANTEVPLELIQNLSSWHDASGDDVLFRVSKDVVSGERAWLREGTLVRGSLRHVRYHSGGAQGRVLEVTVPAVVAVDGTVVPTQGEIRHQGGRRSTGARVIWNVMRVVTVLGGSDTGQLGGKAARLLLGSTTTIYTTDLVWIGPATGVVEAAERKADSPGLRLRLAPETIGITGTLQPRPSIRVHWAWRPEPAERLTFLVERPERPAEVRVRSIEGQSPPVEIRAEELTKKRKGWLCAFDWWQVVRFLPLSDGPGPISLELDGVLEDGTPFVVEVPVYLRLASKP